LCIQPGVAHVNDAPQKPLRRVLRRMRENGLMTRARRRPSGGRPRQSAVGLLTRPLQHRIRSVVRGSADRTGALVFIDQRFEDAVHLPGVAQVEDNRRLQVVE
jgi:hypothetical protein